MIESPPDVRVVGHTGRSERAQVGELLDERLQRHPVPQGDRDRQNEQSIDAREGRPLLAELDEDLTEAAVGVGPAVR